MERDTEGHGCAVSGSEPAAPDPSEVVPTSNSAGAPVDADQVVGVADDDGDEKSPGEAGRPG